MTEQSNTQGVPPNVANHESESIGDKQDEGAVSRPSEHNVKTSPPASRVTVFALLFLVAVAVWLYATTSLLADYAPLILVFVSAIAGIVGKSWNEDKKGLARVTTKGWLLAALAALGFVVGIRNTEISHSKLKEVGKIQTVAYHQLMEGVSMMLFPITSSWREPPKNDADILSRAADQKTIDLLTGTRIVPFADPVRDTMMMVGDTRMFAVSAKDVRISSSCGQPHGTFRALYELFDFCVDTGEAKVKESEQIFLSNLDSETIRLVQDMLGDEYYVSHYKNLAHHDDLYYQGLYDEAVTRGTAPSSDQTWRALIAVQRTLLPEQNDPASPGRKDKTSPYLYLGTYYFGQNNSDSTAYRQFLQKVGALVKHVETVTNSQNVIDTF
ncbi:MAG TPA: hypothetical protein VGR97_02690 [Candidatus Acidoferrales bacterium]|nr:hypothetical protein [Candidatus Acidoferrales bacterium]